MFGRYGPVGVPGATRPFVDRRQWAGNGEMCLSVHRFKPLVRDMIVNVEDTYWEEDNSFDDK